MAALRNIESPERGILFLDADSRITYANLRAAEIFGADLRELTGSVLPERAGRRPLQPDEIIDEVLDGAFGPGLVFHRYSTPVYSSESIVEGRIEIYSDITARRELEKEILDRNLELAQLNRQLQEAQEQLVQSERLRTLGEMAAGVAHDINNVLGIILGNSQLARRKLEPGNPALHSIEAIELAARDGAETVRRLREIGKPVDVSSYATVNLNCIAEDVIRAVIPAWRESAPDETAQIAVETDLADGCTVLGNAAELREALANILLNAVQAIDSRGRIIIRTARADSTAELSVTDTGVGMDNETRKRVFDPFFTTRGAEGTGLGMSAVDAIVIRHGGKVLIDSTEGRGTTVTLRLPLYGGI